jgi:hypothetical protein
MPLAPAPGPLPIRAWLRGGVGAGEVPDAPPPPGQRLRCVITAQCRTVAHNSVQSAQGWNGVHLQS